ncbi:hypothetical protein CQ010_18225 [Arthrobacter sp. MYb211]|nr:hypothetical protein CQ015_18205 [Arthrobacter sp. MYb221]PRC02745.1 hypothetical protein CQ010_18225 [Arthrobacter sp. MYb211]
MVNSQYQTIATPAMGALFAGLFVSIAASYLYEGFSKNDDWRQYAGLCSFFIGLVILAVILKPVLKGVDDPESLARDPHTIQAAAEEYIATPRVAVLDPDVLVRQMKQWHKDISVRSTNISADAQSQRLDDAFHLASRARGFIKLTNASLRIYYAALKLFPFRFLWPILSALVYLVGNYWFAIGSGTLKEAGPVGKLLVLVIPIVCVSLVVMFYSATRGYRAIRWHKVNRLASAKAKRALREAKTVHEGILGEDEFSLQLFSRVDDFLRKSGRGARKEILSLKIGKFSF